MLLLLPAVVFAIAYVLGRRRDRRMLRNGVFLLGAAFFGVLGLVDILARRYPETSVLLVGVFLLVPVALLVLAGFLLANGVRMFRREGRSAGNALSFVAGVAVVAVVVGALLVVRDDASVLTAVLLLALALVGYFGAVFLVFLVYAVVYGRGTVPERSDVLVVLGSGLVRGTVPPLLRGRLDRAIEAYRVSSAAGTVPLVIPSGGQGADEPRAEGAAMAEYLVEHGIPAEQVRPETASTTTRENLVYSRRVQQQAGAEGTVLVVTSDYHVMRAAMLARDVGTDAQVVGARTARYYVPSAFLREFAAVVGAHFRAHLVVVVLVVAAWAWVVVQAMRIA